jgi:hypothetical protein
LARCPDSWKWSPILGMKTTNMLSFFKQSKYLFSKAKVELHMDFEVILRLDIAQESKALSARERERYIYIKERERD